MAAPRCIMADTPEVVELAKRTNLSNVEAATLWQYGRKRMT